MIKFCHNIFYDEYLKDGNEDNYTYDTKAHYLSIPSTYLYNTLRIVYLLEIIVSYIILLSIPFSKNKRGIHEYLSKTRVEKE